MTYQPYLIANWATGLSERLQPWLNADDGQEELFDGYIYRGVLSKRPGYKYFATGERNGLPYRESRIVHTLTAVPMVGAINGINHTFTLAGHTQIARGSVRVTGSNPVQVATDNGVGGFNAPHTGTINYLTGAISVTFAAAPIAASTVTVTYSYMPGNPVMMVATFISSTNTKEMIVADTQYVNRFNPIGNILVDISSGTPYTGTSHDFFTWVNYPNAADDPRLLFCNNVDVIQQWDGTTVTDYAYTSLEFSAITCSWMTQMKDRLILLRTTENTVGSPLIFTTYPQRIRISGFGQNADVFDQTAPGAGFIEIPDGSWIFGAAFNRDDLIIFTESSTWSMKYTGDDNTPFVLDKIDESRGCSATFSAITYLNRTTAASQRGLVISDGYKVDRSDEDIPTFSYDQVDGDNFDLCFAGSVDADRDHYLIYPIPGQEPGQEESKRILVTNYEEDTYTKYRLPLSCMGTFRSQYTITWNDLLIFDNWDQFADSYSNWNSFPYNKNEPISIGGGHHGEIWQLNLAEEEDNPVKVRNITKINANILEITTDWNNFGTNSYDPDMGADSIFFLGVEGMLEINNQQLVIDPNFMGATNNVFRVETPNNTNWGGYTGGGTATRVIPFTALTKQFNPFIDGDKKVRCGWIYMYVDATKSDIFRNVPIAAATNADPCVITTVDAHNFNNGAQVNIFGVGGMTQLNDTQPFITVLSSTTFSLNGVNSTAYGVYTAGGYAGVAEPAKLFIDVYRDDTLGEPTQLMNPDPQAYQGNCTNLTFEDGVKKWYKVFINQTGRFIQFRFKNIQAGTTINIQAMMPGFQPVGRLL